MKKKTYFSIKKKTIKYKFQLTFILLVLFIFIQEFNIFRNLYYIYSLPHEVRVSKAYKKTFFSGHCKKSSHGYLFYVRKKFSKIFNNQKIMPKIINYNGKEEYWVFLKNNPKLNEDYLIVLNNNVEIDKTKYEILDNFNNKCFFLKKIND